MKQTNLIIFAALFVVMMTGLSGVVSAGAGVGEITNVRVEEPVIIGSSVLVTWESSNVPEVTLALEKNGKYVKNLIWNIPNTGSVLWTPDTEIRPDSGYQVVVTEAGKPCCEPASFAKSKKFSIKIVFEKFINLEGGYGFEHLSYWYTVIGTPFSDKNTIFGPEARNGFALGGVAVISHSGSLKEYIEGRGTYLGLFYVDQKKTKVDGREAISAKDKATGNPIVFVKSKDNVITIYFNSNKSDDVKLFNKLVKSFTVLEPEIKISFSKKTKVVMIVSKNIPNDQYHSFGIEYKYPGDIAWRGLLGYVTTNGNYSFTIGTAPNAGVYDLKIPIEIRVTALKQLVPFFSQTLTIKR